MGNTNKLKINETLYKICKTHKPIKTLPSVEHIHTSTSDLFLASYEPVGKNAWQQTCADGKGTLATNIPHPFNEYTLWGISNQIKMRKEFAMISFFRS